MSDRPASARRLVLPSTKLLLLLLLPAAAGIAFPSAATAGIIVAVDLAVIGLLLLDLRVTPGPGLIGMRRLIGAQLSMAADNRVGWEIINRSEHDLRLRVHDAYPDGFVSTGAPLTAAIRAQSTAEVFYTTRPPTRGRFDFGPTFVRYPSRLGLFTWHVRQPLDASVKVYPNVRALSRYELAAQRRRLTELGLTANRDRGRGGVFESLRDYVKGDDPADIAWKATARRGQLTTRMYESERSQNIVVVLDCGRLMTTQVDEMTRLDHAINAALLLTHVAVKQHDYIGLLAFSDQIDAYMPLMKGRAALSRMTESLYRIEPKLREPNYQRACGFLALEHRKRSLIIIITDVIDTDASSMLLAYTARFARYHLPLVVTIRNPQVQHIADRRPEATDDLFEQALAQQMLQRRATALSAMQKSGVNVLDVNPGELTPRLIERYLTLKQRRML